MIPDKPFLNVYCVWHPDCEQANGLVDSLYSGISRYVKNPVARGLGVPVYFRSQPAAPDASKMPAPVYPAEARHTAIFVFVDDRMLEDAGPAGGTGGGWANYVARMHADCGAEGAHRLYLISLSADAFKFHPRLGQDNFLRLYTAAGDPDLTQTFLREAVHALCRLIDETPGGSRGAALSPAPVQLFLSHTKRDGVPFTERLRDWLHKNTGFKDFFDTRDIPPGYRFGREIEEQILRSALLVVLTDDFAGSEWCRREVLTAKRLRVPVVVVDALEAGELRSFPYLGNVPTTHPHGETDFGEIVRKTVLEVFRFRYLRGYYQTMQEAGNLLAEGEVFYHAPELLSIVQLLREGAADPARPSSAAPPKLILYPDPPMGSEEHGLVSFLVPGTVVTTPVNLTRTVGADIRPESLAGKVIALSISNSPDLARLGFGPVHLEDAMVEIARYLLARGATLAYGGDLRPGGFLELLLKLIEGYQTESMDLGALPPRLDAPPVVRAWNYLAWPLWLTGGSNAKNAYRGIVELRSIPPPPEMVAARGFDPAVSLPPTTPENRFLWACSLTAMRREMTAQIDARIVLGGAVAGFKGKYPGIVEEALLTMSAGKPTYLLGAFGGAARAVIEALTSGAADVLTRSYQESHSAGEREFIDHYNETERAHPELASPLDYAALTVELHRPGVDGLRNGLSRAENERLFVEKDIRGMVALVLRGLEAAL